VDSFGAPVTHGFKGHLPGVDAGGQRSLMMGALEKLRFVNEGTRAVTGLGADRGRGGDPILSVLWTPLLSITSVVRARDPGEGN
jgi:hypothetical protein